jgi:leucyl-tRNA synthetase
LNGNDIPIYTADYVLGAYGTGAIMAVPAHDERDFEFAKRFDLPIVEVVSPDGKLHEELETAFTDDGIAVRSGQFDGQPTVTMKKNISAFLEETRIGRRKVNYKLRDWVFSRQRYWGEPIPIHFPVETKGDPRKGDPYTVDYTKPIPLEDSELPLLLPELDDYRPGDPQGPLVRAPDWRFFQKDGRWFARETNTMPQWAGSCWYYLRYLDPRNDERIFSQKSYDDWMPVDLYVGGSEHAVLHLLYARFWHKVLFDLGVVKDAEPFLKLVHQGPILGLVLHFADERPGDDGKVFFPDDPDVELRDGEYFQVKLERKLVPVQEKMSKSRGNVVNPDGVIAEFGADSLRVYEMFMGPLEQMKPWQTAGIQGVRRFLDKVDQVASRELEPGEGSEETRKLLHRTVKKVGNDIDSLRFNTAVSEMMILTNHLAKLERPPRGAVEKLTLCLAPFAPHLAEELWSRLGHEPSIAEAEWPSFDPALCEDDEREIGVQVNGKVRGRVLLAVNAPEDAAREAGLADPNVAKFIEGKTLRKVVYVPGKILNFIVS